MREDRLLGSTRVVAWLVVPFLAAAGAILFLFPHDTEQLWAWPIDPPVTALAIGGGYLAGAVLFVRGLRIGRWHALAVALAGATVLSALLLAATVLHWDRFSHGHVSFWAWTGLYALTPFVLPLLWARNRRQDPGVDEGALVPTGVGRLVGVAGLAGLVVALAAFVRPELAIEVWPWTLTPLTARTLAAFVAFLAVALAAFLLERRWSALALPVEAVTLGLALVGVGALLARADLTGPAGSVAAFWVVLVGVLVGLVVLRLAMRRQDRAGVIGVPGGEPPDGEPEGASRGG